MAAQESRQLPAKVTIEIGDLRVNFLGSASFLEARDAGESPLHIHAVHEFQYIDSGVLHELIDEETVLDAGEGEILFIPPNVLHRNEAGSCRRLVLAITIQRLHRERAADDFSEFQYYCELLGRVREPMVFQDEEIRCCVSGLIGLPNLPQNVHRQKIYLTRLFVRLAECVASRSRTRQTALPIQQGGSSDRQYYLIEQYINTHYNEKTTVDDVAALLHLSRRQADRIVKHIFGKTYAELILERRMSIARTMLQKSGLSCGEIAERCGYSSYTGFYLAFRSFYGYTPDQCRETEKEADMG